MPTIEDLKSQAKRLRASLANNSPITHSQALEAVARQHGYKDWNTIHAACGNAPPGPPWQVGQTVTGAYLGKPVRGTIRSVRSWAEGRMFRITLDLETPVNVSAFDSFEVTRRRLTATLDRNGETVEKITGGTPQLKLDL